MKAFDQDDAGVVVIIGSGAGGGTLANELAQKGIDVVVLEAGQRQSRETFINDEWPSFAQIAWTDPRTTSGSWRVAKDFPNLPAWICKTVGGSTSHWAGASLRFQEHEFRTLSEYGVIGQSRRFAPPTTPYSALVLNSCSWKRSEAPAQCVVVPPTVLQIQAGRFGKSLATRQEPEVERGSVHASCENEGHSSLMNAPVDWRSPASSTTTSMPFCASSLARVPPPAPLPTTTTTPESSRS